MSLFCFLWIPLFYLFWRSIEAPEAERTGEIWALLLGSVVAFVRFMTASLVSPGAFGFFRWLSACVDIVALPAAAPLLVAILLVRFRVFGSAVNYAGFALLWLIPGAAMQAVGWTTLRDPALLLLTPALWTAIAVGVPFFILMMRKARGLSIIVLAGAAMALPLLAATAYWAFFAQQNWLGILFSVLAMIPGTISVMANLFARLKRGLA